MLTPILGNPSTYSDEISLLNRSADELMSYYKTMLLIRECERKIASGRENGLIGGPVHLAIGQEAVAAGVCESLNPNDSVFGAHRSHSQLLALGSDPYKLFCETLGRSDGLAGGRGGSMHLIDNSVGFSGSVPIVAGTVSLSAGAALAHKLRGDNALAVAFFGDGAIEEGVVHETMNFAKIKNLPLIFVVENNLFSSHLHISKRQPNEFVSRYAQSNDITATVVDGNDPVAVSQAMRHLVDRARSGDGPGFLEAITYRWLGHVDWRDDVDVGVNRSADDLAAWKNTDPIRRLKLSMIQQDIATDSALSACEKETIEHVDACWERALNSDTPKASTLLEHVYSE